MSRPMRISVKETGQCQKTLTVEVPPAEVAAAREQVYQELQRSARVPGFRVGRAPRDLVVQYYSGQAHERAIRRVVGEQLPKALAQAKLDVLGDPEITEVAADDGRPLTFTARCEIMPAIPLRRLPALRLTRPSAAVSDPQVAAVLASLQERRASLAPVEPRPLAAGDYAVVDFTCTVAGQVIERRAGAVIGLTPEADASGMSRHLVGVTPGPAAVTFETTLPADLPAAAVAGKPATFSVIVKEVQVKQVPPLDEALAQAAGAQSLAALRDRIRQDLGRELAARARRALEEQVTQRLLAQAPFEVPPSLVQSQAQRLLREHQLQLIYQGLPAAEVAGRRQLLEDRSTRDALQQVKAFFLLRQVAQTQQLMATEPEVAQRLAHRAAQAGRPVEEVRQELQSQRLLSEVAWDVTRGKVFDYLLAQAHIEEEAA